MEPRISVVTLGVQDVGRARAFYERLGWVAAASSNEHVAFFDLGGVVLSLFGRTALADDAGVSAGGAGFSGVALAHNVRDRAAVDRTLAEAKAAGATIVKPAVETFWGGYAGYFSDPDGHLWEIAHNPFWTLDEHGRVKLPA
ncbi:MAG: VOC family protein [Deltaproteobacteria bacterium]|nr:VOC family protein [Deltaproteobacteria bacterium]